MLPGGGAALWGYLDAIRPPKLAQTLLSGIKQRCETCLREKFARTRSRARSIRGHDVLSDGCDLVAAGLHGADIHGVFTASWILSRSPLLSEKNDPILRQGSIVRGCGKPLLARCSRGLLRRCWAHVSAHDIQQQRRPEPTELTDLG